jgi:hypothetical protein
VPRLLRPIVVCAALSALALAAATGSANAAGWLPPVQALNASGASESAPHVAVDAAGNVYATWIEGAQLEAAKRPVGGGWETPEAVPLGTGSKPASPNIGVDSAGNAVLVWKAALSGGSPAIFQAMRPASAAGFATGTMVSDGKDTFVGPPRLEVNGAGRAALTYRDAAGGTQQVTAAIGSVSGGFLNQIRAYDETSAPLDPEVSINESGDAAVVWTVPFNSIFEVKGAYAARGSNFAAGGSAETAGSSSVTEFDAHVAVDSQGRAVATWVEGSPNNGTIHASARSTTAGWNEFSTALDGPFSGTGNEPDVAFDATGAAVAAWGGDGFLRSSLLAPGATQFAQPPQTLAGATEGPSDIDLDANPLGFQVLVWSAQSGAGSARAAVRTSGGVFGPIATLSAAGHATQGERVAVDPTGNAAAVWADSDTGLMTAEYDATPPHFTSGPTVPATARQGTSTAFSAAAADDWSAPTISWDFGDGTSATGGGVTHTYSQAGTFHLVATATDGAGNTVPFSQDITVTAPPVPPAKEGKSFNASQVSGTVFVSVPKGKATGGLLKRAVVHVAAGPVISAPHGYTGFRRLGKNDNVPVGSILDATRGVSQIRMAANHAGTKFQKGTFSQGAFLIKQTTHSPLTSAEMLGGGNFTRDCKAGGAKVLAGAARRRPHRQLFAHVKGHFRTRGRHSTATVRGTKYLVKDTCAGTLTRVTQGRVVVRDFRRHKTVIVKTGHQYLARV